jgi:hypothetical protein
MDVFNDDPEDMEVMASDRPDFDGGVWQPYQREFPWELEAPEFDADGPVGGDPVATTVYVRFRDPSQNESETYSITFELFPPGVLGAIAGMVDLVRNDNDERVAILTPNNPDIQPAYTDENGDFLLDSLPAGTYLLLLSHSGYAGLMVEVEVAAGETVDIGTLMMEPAPRIYLPILSGPD